VLDATPASFFDASQSESYGEPSTETAVAFEAEDGVMFEAAFEGAPAIDDPAVAVAVAAGPVVTDALDAVTPPPLPVAAPDVIDSRAAVSDTEDRVLLQFAATVPHDLAELRRIAADNQW
jgi:hypothetical protein